MRELKFRAWDIKSQHMCEVHSMSYSMGLGENGEITYSLYWDPIEKINKQRYWPSFEIMQFTGMHDKNGKEIYEGDILKSGYVVKWDDELTGFYPFNAFHSDFCKIYPANEQIVIGNILENPELIPSPDTFLNTSRP